MRWDRQIAVLNRTIKVGLIEGLDMSKDLREVSELVKWISGERRVSQKPKWGLLGSLGQAILWRLWGGRCFQVHLT